MSHNSAPSGAGEERNMSLVTITIKSNSSTEFTSISCLITRRRSFWTRRRAVKWTCLRILLIFFLSPSQSLTVWVLVRVCEEHTPTYLIPLNDSYKIDLKVNMSVICITLQSCKMQPFGSNPIFLFSSPDTAPPNHKGQKKNSTPEDQRFIWMFEFQGLLSMECLQVLSVLIQ